MAVKILVVDDSTTMRKIMAMTFAAESAQVETVGGVDAALQKLDSFAPDVVFADLSMAPDGYELAKAVKAKNPNTAVIALSSQHTTFDAAKGGAAGIDDNIVKPFDTQSVIDRVAQVLARPRAQLLAGATLAGVPQTGGAAPAAAPAAPVAPAAPRPPMTAPGSSAAIPLAASPRDMKRTMAFGMPLAPVANPVGPVQGATPGAPPTNTVSMPNASIPAGPAPVVPRPAGAVAAAPAAPAAPSAPAAVAPTAPAAVAAVAAPAVPKPVPVAPPVVSAPAPAVPKPVPAPPPAAAPVAPAPAASPVAAVAGAVVSASLATKLGGLGLSKDQIEGVLALSREIVEQVVWEVVPELAETMIREEIKRLTAG